MKSLMFLIVCVALLSLVGAAAAQNDLMIKKTSDMKIPGMPDMGGMMGQMGGSNGNNMRKARTTTVLIKGSRLRADSQIPSFKFSIDPDKVIGTREMSYIQQCDMGRTVHLDHKKKSYTITSIAGGDSSPPKAKAAEKVAKAKKGGYMEVAMNVTDTNERKNMFGFVAKHLRSTMTLTPSANACNKQAMSIQDDGWYIDLPTYACEIQTDDTMSSMQETAEDCVDEIRIKPGQNMHLGFALQQTRTFTANGMSFQMLENVISLDRTALDPSLFEIPADFRPTSDSDANVATSIQPSSASTPLNNTVTPPSTGASAAYPADWQNKPLPEMSQITTDTGLPPKQPGVIRIGIVTPTTEMGQGFEGVNSGQIVQFALLEKLKAERIESVPISSGVLIQSEAKMKQCDYLLYVDVKRKKGGGGFMKQMIISSVISNVAGLAGNAAGAAASAASQAAVMSGNFKNKDEITLEYHIDKADGGAAVTSTSLKKKAQKDGDDVLSPLIDDAAKNIVATLTTSK